MILTIPEPDKATINAVFKFQVFTTIKDMPTHEKMKTIPQKATTVWFSLLWSRVNHFYKVSTFLFYLALLLTGISDFSPDFDLSGFVYTPKINDYNFSKLLPVNLIFQTSLLSFNLKLL